VRLERARVPLAGDDLRLEALEPQPATASKQSRGETSTFPSRVAAARLKPTVRKRSLPAWRQQTAYLPFGWR